MDPKTPQPRKMGRRLGQSGTQIFNGYITAEEYNTKLIGLAGLRQYDIMRKSDPIVRQTLQIVKLPVQQVDWRIEAASDDAKDKTVAAFINRELFERNVDWSRFSREVLTMLDFGHSIFEKTLGLTEYDGKTFIGIEELGYRKQTTVLKWEGENGKDGITQQLVHTNNVSIPREKLIYFVFDQEGDNYQGVSLLRYAFKPWDFKHKYELMNGIATERHSAGVPVVEVPDNASQNEKDEIDDIMRAFRINEEGYIRKPKNVVVELLNMNSNSLKDVLPSIQYYDRQIQSSVLAQFLSLGSTSASGSRAVSDDQSKLFLMSEEALAKQIQATLQKELINQLCDLNFVKLENGYPKLKFGKIGDENVEELGDYVHKLSGSGAIKYDPEVENHLRRVGGLPEMPEDMLKKAKEANLKRIEEGELNDPKNKKTNPQVDKKNQKDIEATLVVQAHNLRENLLGAYAEG